jgi:hypothetical protein
MGYLGQNLARIYPHRTKQANCHSRAQADERFLHLACPRNRQGSWDWRTAEDALDAGIVMAERCGFAPEQCMYASSLSVFDQPDNEYAKFKRMAERVVLAKGWHVVRLPTLLGGNPIRKDLGLHQIATNLADGKGPLFVNPNVVRHVMHIDEVCFVLVQKPKAAIKVHAISLGWVAFTDIVPRKVERRVIPGASTYTCTVGSPMDRPTVVALRGQFRALVSQIKAGTVAQI